MKLQVRRCVYVLLAFFCILTICACRAEAAPGQRRVLRVAFPETPGFSMFDDNGNPYGLVVDFLNEIAQYTGWEYEYVMTDVETILRDFHAGKYDLMGSTYYLPTLEDIIAYPEYNTGYSRSVLLSRWDDTTITGFKLSDLNGKTIGVHARAEENIRRLKIFLSINGLDCTIKAYTPDQLGETLLPVLESGQVDLILGNSTDNNGIYRPVAFFDSQPHYIVTTPDNKEVLDGLNWALKHIYESDPDFASNCYTSNFPEDIIEVTLNSEEMAYVEKQGTVTVAVPGIFHPFMCLNNDESDHNGIIPDILEKVTEYSGLQFDYIFTDTYIEALSLVQQGQADIVGFFLDSKVQAAAAGLSLTQPYIKLSGLVLRHKSVSFPADGLTFGVLNGRQLPSDINAGQIRYYDNIRDGLLDVDKGEIDCLYGVTAWIENELQRHSYYNVAPVSLLGSQSNISFALSKPANPNLISILNKTITNLNTAELDVIASRNVISAGVITLTLSDLLYNYPVQVLVVLLILLLLFTSIIVLVAKSRVKAAVLHTNLEKAKADSRAKSEFLSRMSHEIRTPMNAIVGLTELTSMLEDLPEQVQTNLSKLRSSSRYLLSLINDILDMSRIDSHKMTLTNEPFSLIRMLDEIKSMMESEASRSDLRLAVDTKVTHTELTGDVIRLRQVLTNLLSNAIKFTSAGGQVQLCVTETGSDGTAATILFQVIDSGIGIPPEDQKRIFAAFEQSGTGSARSKGTGLGLPISYNIVQLMGGELQLKSQMGQGSEFYFEIKLPYGVLEEAPIEQNTSELLSGARLLLVEDNGLNAEIAIELLRMQGAQIQVATDGSQGVKLFSASAPGEYQAILMDIQMPVMDGLTATRTIRALDRPDAASIPIIAMTANSFQEDMDAATAAGMDGFVTKPLDVDYLYGTLRKLLQKAQDA